MQNDKNRDIEKMALYYLANFYYDREYLTWDKFGDMAVVFYRNSYLEDYWNRRTRKKFKQMSLYLLKILKIINQDKNKATWLYYEEDLQPISLGKMDGRNHLSHYDQIAELSLKMRNCIKDKTFIHDYIFSLKDDVISEVMYLKCSYEIDESIKAKIFEQFAILNEINDTHPEDIFRQIKIVKRLLNQNSKIKRKKELENEKIRKEKVKQINSLFIDEEREEVLKRANATLGRMYALQEVTTDKICKTILAKDILEFEMSLHSGNIETIQNEIERLEEIFETSTRRSR